MNTKANHASKGRHKRTILSGLISGFVLFISYVFILLPLNHDVITWQRCLVGFPFWMIMGIAGEYIMRYTLKKVHGIGE